MRLPRRDSPISPKLHCRGEKIRFRESLKISGAAGDNSPHFTPFYVTACHKRNLQRLSITKNVFTGNKLFAALERIQPGASASRPSRIIEKYGQILSKIKVDVRDVIADRNTSRKGTRILLRVNILFYLTRDAK